MHIDNDIANLIAEALKSNRVVALSFIKTNFVTSSTSEIVFEAISASRVTNLVSTECTVEGVSAFPPPGWNLIANSILTSFHLRLAKTANSLTFDFLDQLPKSFRSLSVSLMP